MNENHRKNFLFFEFGYRTCQTIQDLEAVNQLRPELAILQDGFEYNLKLNVLHRVESLLKNMNAKPLSIEEASYFDTCFSYIKNTTELLKNARKK